ncbi:MAG: 3-phosphoshikimate 1-carboxyvinyltransferase [Spirochaetales bacterium]|nr:3-phosphoshikimate 1-carboxyvinyltransferase [Spirochaetales bacterium]
MDMTIRPARATGSVRIPGSKSHTIRALVIATLAGGESTILDPLDSSDTQACVDACRAFGAEITEHPGKWTVTGTAGKPMTPENVIDVRNSGTTLYLLAGIAALQEHWVIFTGDGQIRSRPAGPLLQSLKDLGARVLSTKSDGRAPFLVGGTLAGGKTIISCPTSQYLSGLLLAAPLASGDTEIEITLLNEKPYVEMTLSWLDNQHIKYENDNFKRIFVRGGQKYVPFSRSIPGDFSSATFFLCAAAVCGTSLTVEGLDFNDPQGDKAVVGMLEALGCRIEREDGGVTVHGGNLAGCDLDLNATPDALPALAVTACFAEGTTRLLNVPQARLKETDRITVMREELSRMGADIEELPDGLVIHGRRKDGKPRLAGTRVNGRGDHRVVMALAIAALGAAGETQIEGAEAVNVTFPEFFRLLDSVTKGVE